LVEAAEPYLLHSIQPASIEAVSALFKQRSLPRVVNIDRDPFDTEFSVWYSIVDMFDLVKLIKSIGKGLVGISRGRIHDPRTAKDLHDANLLTRFGIIPTIADIQELINQIKTWKDRYDNSSEAILKVRRYRFDKVSLSSVFPSWKETVLVPFPRTNGKSILVSVESKTTASWRGSMDYRFHCPEFSCWLARVKQIMDSFGILDPAAAWDKVPFSFVLDWFFTTSQWLHAFKPRLFPAEVLAIDYSESITVDTSISYRVRTSGSNLVQAGAFPSVPVPDYYDQMIGFNTYKTYVRKRFRPDPTHIRIVSNSPSLKGNRKVAVDLNRVAVSASLLGQRIPR
jgi:hypothetical protein